MDGGRRRTYDIAVKNFSPPVSEGDLRELFQDHGDIVDINLLGPTERYPKPMAFVRFAAEESVSSAISALNGGTHFGEFLKVERAISKRERSSGGERSFGGSRGFRSYDNSYRPRSNFRNNGSSQSNSTFHDSSSHYDEPSWDSPSNNSSTRRPAAPPWSKTSNQTRGVDEKELKVMVVSIEPNLRIWVQIDEQDAGTRLSEMTEQLQMVCAEASVVRDPIEGKIYGGLYASDQMWYRCELISVSPRGPEVQFIDFGDTEVIEIEDGLVELPDEISNQPKMARPMVMAGVPYPAKQVSPALCDKISQLILEKDMIAVVKSYNPSAEASEVELSFPDEEGPVNDKVLKAIKDWSLNGGAPVQTESTQNSVKNESTWMPKGSRGESSSRNDVRSTSSRMDSPKSRGQRPFSQESRSADRHATSQRHFQLEIDDLKQQLAEEKAKREEAESAAAQSAGITNEFSALLKCIAKLRMLRQSVPGKVSDALQTAIEVACDDSSKCSSIILPGLLELERQFDSVQEHLSSMKKGEELTAEVAKRNRLRQEFHAKLIFFLDEVKTLPVDRRLNKLQTSIDDLLRSYGKQCRLLQSVPPPTDLNATLNRYEEWRLDRIRQLEEVQETTDTSAQAVQDALQSLERQFDVHCSEEMACPDLDHLTKALRDAAEAESTKTGESVNEKGRPCDIVRKTAQAVLYTLRSQQQTLRELCKHKETYTSQQVGLEQWLDNEPDISAVEDCRREVRALRSQVRHKMVDMTDVEESTEREALEQEIDLLLLRLHEQYNMLDQHLWDVLELVPYFPELPVLYPQLGLRELQEGHGFVKEGRLLDHYRLESALRGVDVPSYLTKFAGERCILQEFLVGTDEDVIRKRVLSYAKCHHPCLQSVGGVFFDKLGKKMFVQLPYHHGVPFNEWLAAEPSTSERYGVMLGLLAAIGTLHTGQVCHGAIQPQLVRILLTQRGTAHPVLMAFNFSKTDEQRASSVSSPAPEISSVAHVSRATDMYAFGLLMMSAYLPKINIKALKYGTDGSLELPQGEAHPQLVNFLKVLLHRKPSLRLTAAQAMKHPFIASPPNEEVPPAALQGHDLMAVSDKQLGSLCVADSLEQEEHVANLMTSSRHNFWQCFLPPTNMFLKTLEPGIVEHCLLPPMLSSSGLKPPGNEGSAEEPIGISDCSSPLPDDSMEGNGMVSSEESALVSSHEQDEASGVLSSHEQDEEAS